MARVSLINGGKNIVEDPLTFNLVVMTLVRISTEICKNDKIRLLIKEKANGEKRRDRLFCDIKMWKKIRAHMEKSFLENRAIPPLVQRQLFFITRPIIGEIIKWFGNHRSLFRMNDIFEVRDGFDIMQCVVWTAHGTINEYETALSIVNNSRVHVVDRIFVGCTYCLVDLVNAIANRMSEAEKVALFILSSDMNPVIRFWLLDECSDDEVFIWAYYNNTHALNFIFEKLGPTTQSFYIRILRNVLLCSPKIFNFIAFKQNTDDFSTFMIRKHPSLVLSYFLDWPNQNKFYESANQLMRFMEKEDFHELFCNVIYNKISQECNDFDYRNVIIYLWDNCPENVKSHMSKQWVYPQLIYTIENDIVVNRELLVKEKMHNLILMTGYWIKYIINNYGLQTVDANCGKVALEEIVDSGAQVSVVKTNPLEGEIAEEEGKIKIRSAFGGKEETPLKTFKMKINDNEHVETLVTCDVSEKLVTDILISKGAYETLRQSTELQSSTTEKGKVYGEKRDFCEKKAIPLNEEREIEHVLSWKGKVKEKGSENHSESDGLESYAHSPTACDSCV
ncbi:hypothetical protein AVEN_94928-1 [Araneus ventricosus]|uniref:Uncharacterized protein n=1 Tax=Araneus ventricosus TaxID=182803 RepID=A0A4Y2DI02_ARAVE|nr:hypothetical protein AVEN_94928-1 [Araneus ventricosus]